MSKYEELKKRMETEGSSKLAQVCLSAVLDKADIGTGNKEWIQITPEEEQNGSIEGLTEKWCIYCYFSWNNNLVEHF